MAKKEPFELLIEWVRKNARHEIPNTVYSFQHGIGQNRISLTLPRHVDPKKIDLEELDYRAWLSGFAEQLVQQMDKVSIDASKQDDIALDLISANWDLERFTNLLVSFEIIKRGREAS